MTKLMELNLKISIIVILIFTVMAMKLFPDDSMALLIYDSRKEGVKIGFDKNAPVIYKIPRSDSYLAQCVFGNDNIIYYNQDNIIYSYDLIKSIRKKIYISNKRISNFLIRENELYFLKDHSKILYYKNLIVGNEDILYKTYKEGFYLTDIVIVNDNLYLIKIGYNCHELLSIDLKTKKTMVIDNDAYEAFGSDKFKVLLVNRSKQYGRLFQYDFDKGIMRDLSISYFPPAGDPIVIDEKNIILPLERKSLLTALKCFPFKCYTWETEYVVFNIKQKKQKKVILKTNTDLLKIIDAIKINNNYQIKNFK